MNLIAQLVALAIIAPAGISAQAVAAPEGPANLGGGPMRTPESIRQEHAEIHAALERAAREAGEVGAAAQDLHKVLGPHFRREEEIATPPLALLVPLSRGPVTAQMRAVLPMTDALERELPGMLEEHRRIGAARQRLEEAARRAGKSEYVRLSETLAHHARQEEEVLYPAAILVGRFVKSAAAAP